MNGQIKNSELILTPEGEIYHLRLRPGQLADKIILVGDPGRVPMISQHFERIEYTNQNREICTHTGYYKGVRISAMSTGMGTDNIDIVLNELDALVNIDFDLRAPRSQHHKLEMVRLGTSGALQKQITPGDFVVSSWGLGLDGLLNYYSGQKEKFSHEIAGDFITHSNWPESWATPYVVPASEKLFLRMGDGLPSGITATAPGFYGPQGRLLRAGLLRDDMNEMLMSFDHNGLKVVNFEMETSAIYGLCSLLGHEALTICVAIANRATGDFLNDYHPRMEALVKHCLDNFIKE